MKRAKYTLRNSLIDQSLTSEVLLKLQEAIPLLPGQQSLEQIEVERAQLSRSEMLYNILGVFTVMMCMYALSERYFLSCALALVLSMFAGVRSWRSAIQRPDQETYRWHLDAVVELAVYLRVSLDDLVEMSLRELMHFAKQCIVREAVSLHQDYDMNDVDVTTSPGFQTALDSFENVVKICQHWQITPSDVNPAYYLNLAKVIVEGNGRESVIAK